MLKCADGTYYVGQTDDIEKRIAEHKNKHFKYCYTATRLPVELVYQATFMTRNEAFAAEQKIKKWSSKKKAALCNNDWLMINKLGKKKFKI